MHGDPRYAIPLKGGGDPKRRLRDYAAKPDPVPEPVDLVHVTTAAWIDSILNAGQLETRLCSVLNKELVYFFVGHAAYRSKEGDEKTSNLARFPAAFLVVPDRLPAPWHVYPFDTGAAAGGLFPHDRTASVRLGDFELDNTLDAIRRFIAFAFGGTQNYLHHRLDERLDEAIPRVIFEGRDYIAIARLASETRNDLPDRRAATIEVAYGHHITLRSHAKLLVLPDAMVEDILEGRALRQRVPHPVS